MSPSNLTDANLAHPSNTLFPKEVTLAGTLTLGNDVHEANVESLIAVIFLDNVTDANFPQRENASSPILVTLSGTTICVNAEQFLNAALPIPLILLGIVTPFNTEHPEKHHLKE